MRSPDLARHLDTLLAQADTQREKDELTTLFFLHEQALLEGETPHA